MGLFSSYDVRGFCLVGVCGLFIAVTFVAEHRLSSAGASVVVHGLHSSWTQEHRLSSCGTLAWLPFSMWGLPRPGIKPVSPALAGGVLNTQPPVNLTPLGTSYKWSHNVFVPL